MIDVEVLGQNLIIVSNYIVSDSVKYLKVKFNFSNDWSGFTKTALFYSDSLQKPISVVLEKGNALCVSENICFVPFEVIKADFFQISVFGILNDTIITTDKQTVKVFESGYSSSDNPSSPTESEYQQIINIVNQCKNISNSVRADANNGLFKGDKGDKGDDGAKGEKGEKGEKGLDGITPIIDQEYSPNSLNAVSGVAISKIIGDINRLLSNVID